MTPHEQYFRRICQGMLAIGVKPTPTTINRFMHRHRSRFNSINGREAQWRRDELIEAGWTEPNYYTTDRTDSRQPKWAWRARWSAPNGQ